MNRLTTVVRQKGPLAAFIIAVITVAVWAGMNVDFSGDNMTASVPTQDYTLGEFVSSGPFEVAVSLTSQTPQKGSNTIVIEVRDDEGQSLENATVRAVAQMTATKSMPSMLTQANMLEVSPGVYQGDLELSMAGTWTMAVDAATDQEHHVDLSFELVTARKGLRLITATPIGDVAYHTCSMHPSVKAAEAGSCPICGMDLIAVTTEEANSGSILIDEGRRQLIGVTLGVVEKGDLTVPIKLHGKIAYDESRLSDISLRFDGWVGDINADFEGKAINQGDVLFTVYSPELLSLQQAHLETIKRGKKDALRQALITASRKRLSLWGLTKNQISWLERQGKAQDYIPILATDNGVVIQKNIVQGSAFKRGDQLLRLADLSKVWVEVFAYERDLALIKPDMPASILLPNSLRLDADNTERQANIMQIDPFVDQKTRSAKVRLQVSNTNGALKPGMFASAVLKVKLLDKLLIPEDAVLVSGDKRIVFIDLGNGRFKAQTITTGYADGQRVIVLDGLSEGDAIVTSGNFLIAAESKLKTGGKQW